MSEQRTEHDEALDRHPELKAQIEEGLAHPENWVVSTARRPRGDQLDLEVLRESLPPVSAEEVLPRVLSAMSAAQEEVQFRSQQMQLARHAANVLSAVEHNPASLQAEWLRFEGTARKVLGLPEPATPRPEVEPGALIEDWLSQLDPRWLEEQWLSSTYAKSNAQCLKEAMMLKVRNTKSLWSAD